MCIDGDFDLQWLYSTLKIPKTDIDMEKPWFPVRKIILRNNGLFASMLVYRLVTGDRMENNYNQQYVILCDYGSQHVDFSGWPKTM